MGRTNGGNHARSYLSRRLDRCDSGGVVLLRSSLASWRLENTTPAARSDIAPRFLQWSPIVLGAFAATALSSVLLIFAVTIGLGVTSMAPTWRDASAALAMLSGLYLIIQAILSFGLGGYIAGRIRAPISAAAREETEQADGVHGLGVWALAVIMGAALAALIGAASLHRTPSMRRPAQASSAAPLLSYELDRLFRAGRRAHNVDLSAERAEAAASFSPPQVTVA